MFDIDDTPAVSREELARKAVLEHYAGAAGGQGDDPFSLLLVVKASGSLQMRDLLLTRSHYQSAAGAQEREKIRTRINSTMLKAARQGLVRRAGNEWSITDRGRQFVIAGIHSRASTYRLGTLTMEEACEMCEEDEMPGCHTPETSATWPSTITADFARSINAWMNQGAGSRGCAAAGMSASF